MNGPLLAMLVGLTFAPLQDAPPLRLVDSVDLSRYAGLWYEVARVPNAFQEQCAGDVTATFALRDDGRLDVVNRCRRGDGSQDEARGVARKADADGPAAALEVRFAPAILTFIPAVWGDYRIIGLGDQYRWAVVGDPAREYLWILSRTPDLPRADYDRAVEIARANRFDVSRLQRTRHSGPTPGRFQEWSVARAASEPMWSSCDLAGPGWCDLR